MTLMMQPNAAATAARRRAAAGVAGPGEMADMFRYGRIMPVGAFQPMMLKSSVAQRLGGLMTTERSDRPAADDSTIPAGYTYFAQFVDHDVTMDFGGGDAAEPGESGLEAVFEGAQTRAPSLDLDSLYGDPAGRDRGLYDGPRFRIGRTAPAPGAQGRAARSLPNDLPRQGVNPVTGGPRALIADPRNDENLAVAQVHLVWMHVHNSMVDALAAQDPGCDPALLFARARALTVRHYQWIVLHDLVRRFVPVSVFNDVILDGNRLLLHTAPGEIAFMPVEFSVAAFRMGHSMVRNAYDWNRDFAAGAEGGAAGLRRLTALSGQGGDMEGGAALPTGWTPDFRRLFDLGDYTPAHLSRAARVARPNFARRLDPFLAADLGDLPELGGANLAFRNLRRGAMQGLPSAQDFARFTGDRPLTADELSRPLELMGKTEFHEAMTQAGLYRRTPLWLYILLEAAATQGGERLGPLGGRIVAETFLTLALTSRVSIFQGGKTWSPADAAQATCPPPGRPLEDMANLLVWIDGATPIVNPLEDERTGAA